MRWCELQQRGTSSFANSILSINFAAPSLSACSLAVSSIAKDIATVGHPIVRGFFPEVSVLHETKAEWRCRPKMPDAHLRKGGL